MSLFGFDKKKDIKAINEQNQELKKGFKNALILSNGWVIGDSVLTIGQHFSKVDDSIGLSKFKPKDKILGVNTQELYQLISNHKKEIEDIDLNEKVLQFILSNGSPLVIGQFIEELLPKYKDTIDILQSTKDLLINGIELDDDTIHKIYKNKHFVIVPTGIEDVRISKELLPEIKSTAKEISSVTVYGLASQNKHMFRVIFKIENTYATHYHIYMVIRKEQ